MNENETNAAPIVPPTVEAVFRPQDLPCQNECCNSYPSCEAVDDGYICTRHFGHSGDHVACGGTQSHALHTWPNTVLNRNGN